MDPVSTSNQKPSQTIDQSHSETSQDKETNLNIARRTRSQLRIDNFIPTDHLDFPDVELSLYQAPDSAIDPVYKNFLDSCWTEDLLGESNNDDNDPPYVYNEHILSPGWQYDLDEGLDQIKYQYNTSTDENLPLPNENHDTSNHLPSTAHQLIKLEHNDIIQEDTKQTTSIPSPTKSTRLKTNLLGEQELATFNQQLRQDIQLLTQTNIVARHSTNLSSQAEEVKVHLDKYFEIFEHKNKPANLLAALELVNNLETPKVLRSSIRLSWRPIPLPESVNIITRNHPNVFLYSLLLPKVAFSFLPQKLMPQQKQKITFTENEDKLLAYALNEFKNENRPYALIASLLMPAKTKTQISNHIKNIKRSNGCELNPIKIYYSTGELPQFDLSIDRHLVDPNLIVKEEEENDKGEEGELEEAKEEEVEEKNDKEEEEIDKDEIEEVIGESDDLDDVTPVDLVTTPPPPRPDDPDAVDYQHSDILDSNLEDLITASITISKKSSETNTNTNQNKNLNKNMKLKKSMLNLMSHNFLLSESMGDLIIHDFLNSARQKLSENHNIQLLNLLARLSNNPKEPDDQRVVTIYQEITTFLRSINASADLIERTVLFLNLDQATKSGCALNYLHWMKFFEFMQHVELYHDRLDVLEKKLVRLSDALQKEDMHKVRLAIANLIEKHPFLKRQFESLSLDEKPHPSLFIWEEDFDDITVPMNLFTNEQNDDDDDLYDHEHFYSKVSEEELRYASQACPCKCHWNDEKFSQHCEKCNLKFVKGRMYLVNKIKPILAEWSYTGKQRSSPPKPPPSTSTTTTITVSDPIIGWTLEEDREILEFCRMKAEQSGEAISFDTSMFEELVNKRRIECATDSNGSTLKRSTREIAERFDQLMDIYREEHPNSSSNQSQRSSSMDSSRRGGGDSTSMFVKEDALMRDSLAHHQ